MSSSPSSSPAGLLLILPHSPSKSSVASRSRLTGMPIRLDQSAVIVVPSTENSFVPDSNSPVPAV